ncbi:MAG: hypothetical protein U5L09_16470 [Bacteroidales bacterium]|nr:hypothetical protein [Bacteroidales bacterium]
MFSNYLPENNLKGLNWKQGIHGIMELEGCAKRRAIRYPVITRPHRVWLTKTSGKFQGRPRVSLSRVDTQLQINTEAFGIDFCNG